MRGGGLDLQRKKKNFHFLKNSQPTGGEGGGSGGIGMVSHPLPVLNYDSFPNTLNKPLPIPFNNCIPCIIVQIILSFVHSATFLWYHNYCLQQFKTESKSNYSFISRL